MLQFCSSLPLCPKPNPDSESLQTIFHPLRQAKIPKSPIQDSDTALFSRIIFFFPGNSKQKFPGTQHRIFVSRTRFHFCSSNCFPAPNFPSSPFNIPRDFVSPMDPQDEAICKSSNSFNFLNGLSMKHSAWFEIRLFYVRISPCVIDCVPDHLKLCHPRREIGVSLEMNGSRLSPSETASLTLRRDRVDKESSEVTYVSTDNIRVTGGVEFEVYENDGLILCGSLERMDADWTKGNAGLGNDSKTGWSMDCHVAMSIGSASSAFFQPKLGVSAPAIEVYVAGCCSGVPVILTKTIQMSPRRRVARHATLDAIPEDEEVGKEQKSMNGLIRQRKLPISGSEVDDYEAYGKMEYNFYAQDMYPGEDGQLSWFNAGVRVGVGIGLGMCLGIGVGVGLLMRSYRTTTRNFRRRFF